MQIAEIVLASSSPRRLELTSLLGWEVRVTPAEVPESRQENESAEAMTRRLALAKAKAAEMDVGLVLGADTVVVDGNQLLGKPKDHADARRMLEALRGRQHRVVTSIALIDPASGNELVDTCESRVPMREYSENELDGYLTTDHAMDKAGSYAIQDGDFRPVEVDQMEDCYANVMGLPLCHVARNLPQALPVDIAAACQQHTGYRCPIYSQVLEGTR